MELKKVKSVTASISSPSIYQEVMGPGGDWSFHEKRNSLEKTLMLGKRDSVMRVKEESAKNGPKLNIKKTKIMATGPITSWETEGKDEEAVTDFTFLGSVITADGDSSHKIKDACFLGGKQLQTSTAS